MKKKLVEVKIIAFIIILLIILLIIYFYIGDIFSGADIFPPDPNQTSLKINIEYAKYEPENDYVSAIVRNIGSESLYFRNLVIYIDNVLYPNYTIYPQIKIEANKIATINIKNTTFVCNKELLIIFENERDYYSIRC